MKRRTFLKISTAVGAAAIAGPTLAKIVTDSKEPKYANTLDPIAQKWAEDNGFDIIYQDGTHTIICSDEIPYEKTQQLASLPGNYGNFSDWTGTLGFFSNSKIHNNPSVPKELSEKMREKFGYAVHGMDGLNVIIHDNQFGNSIEDTMKEAAKAEGAELSIIPHEKYTIYIYNTNESKRPIPRVHGVHDICYRTGTAHLV